MTTLLETLVINKIGRTRADRVLGKFPAAGLIGVGRHSVVLKQGELAIKVEKDTPAANGAIADEAKWLKFFNNHGIAPKIVEHNETLRYVTYLYVSGDFIPEFMEKCDDKERIREVIRTCFEKCRKMDELGVNKKEMHKPVKHIIVGKDVKFIDFERCYKAKRGKNVTQLCDFFFISDGPVAKKIRKLFGITKEKALAAVKSYKKKPDLEKVLVLIYR